MILDFFGHSTYKAWSRDHFHKRPVAYLPCSKVSCFLNVNYKYTVTHFNSWLSTYIVTYNFAFLIVIHVRITPINSLIVKSVFMLSFQYSGIYVSDQTTTPQRIYLRSWLSCKVHFSGSPLKYTNSNSLHMAFATTLSSSSQSS